MSSLLVVLLALNALAGSFKVLTEETLFRDCPSWNCKGIAVETKDSEGEVLSRIGSWILGRKGWACADFLEVNQERFTITGEWKEGNSTLKVAVANVNIPVEREGEESVIGAGESFLLNGTEIIYQGKNWSFKEISKKKPDLKEIVEKMNRLIDEFNSAKKTSAIAERFGYFVKTLPVKMSDLKLVELSDGFGLRMNLKYITVLKSGRIVETRRTRLILKRSNFELWRRLSEVAFSSGINKFVEISVLRYAPKRGFENMGFIAEGYSFFREGLLNDIDGFMDASEYEFSEDLWFFEEEIYERVGSEYKRKSGKSS
jgi:hypothetical protein